MTTNNALNPGRVASIDVFRALTMLCMIFVNDFWTLSNVPYWMEHARRTDSLLGFSDIVFPAFLFAVGLSIPFAIEHRLAKGDSKRKAALHIVLRSFALLMMGHLLANSSSVFPETVGITKELYVILITVGLFLVWNTYPKASGWKKYLFISLQLIGVVLLVYLFVIFRDRGGNMMRIRSWSILWMIGWTYLLCALVYLVARKRLFVHLLAMVAFMLLSMAGSNRWLGFFDECIISNGALHGFTMAGIVVSLLLSRYGSAERINKQLAIIAAAGIGMLLAGFVAREWWIISKLLNTPTWVFLCTGISLLLYVFIYWLVELKGGEHWFKIVKPAGTATLTCYLLPDVVYQMLEIWDKQFYERIPDVIRMFPMGLLKSLAFGILIIWLTALLGKIHIKLKV
jgi:predicted acyltransferase